MPEAHWIFMVLSALVIATAGVLAVIREVRQEGILWQTWALRAFFLVVTAGVGYAIPLLAPNLRKPPLSLDPWFSTIGAIGIFFLVFSAEVFAGAVNISVLTFGGVLGLVVAHLVYFPLLLVLEPNMGQDPNFTEYTFAIKLLLCVVFTYLFVVLIHKNRDRFNFIIPYVEFRRERRGGSAVLVDTSAIIDGRLGDLCETRLIEGPLVVPKFVLRELQLLADSAERIKRARGRRGLDIVNRLRKSPNVVVQVDEGRVPGPQDVDAKLIKLAETLGARILTTDANLQKLADVQGIEVINVNDVAAAVRPSVLPNEELSVELIRGGEAAGQAVGYMPDGTMVVVESARQHIGSTVDVIVTRLLQTASGRIIFAKLATEAGTKARGRAGEP